MTSIQARAAALAACTAILGACGSSEPEPDNATDVVQPEIQPDTQAEQVVAEPTPPAPPPVTVTAGENEALPEGPAASVKILAPRRDQVIKRGAVKVRLQVKNWNTAAGGPHVRPADMVIIGDTPLDIAVAVAGGARSVGVATGNYDVDTLLESGADAAFVDLEDTERVLAALIRPR